MHTRRSRRPTRRNITFLFTQPWLRRKRSAQYVDLRVHARIDRQYSFSAVAGVFAEKFNRLKLKNGFSVNNLEQMRKFAIFLSSSNSRTACTGITIPSKS